MAPLNPGSTPIVSARVFVGAAVRASDVEDAAAGGVPPGFAVTCVSVRTNQPAASTTSSCVASYQLTIGAPSGVVAFCVVT